MERTRQNREQMEGTGQSRKPIGKKRREQTGREQMEGTGKAGNKWREPVKPGTNVGTRAEQATNVVNR